MRTESLRQLQQAQRINPHVTVSELAGDEEYGEAIIDVYAHVKTAGATSFDPKSWDALLDAADEDQTTLSTFMDSPEVRTLIRAQEAPHANA